MRCLGEVERWDRLLASFAPAETALRLRLGQALEVLCSEERRAGHFELGFSSVAAYALERCDRSVRWVEAARCLARRLEPLPELRRAMTLGVASGGAVGSAASGSAASGSAASGSAASGSAASGSAASGSAASGSAASGSAAFGSAPLGSVSWSMGELLARVARPQDELRWIEAAAGRTVREMRGLVLEAMADERAGGRPTAATHAARLVAPAKELAEMAEQLKNADQLDGATQEVDAEGEEDGGAMCTLTCTVDFEEAWLFEATRALLEQLGTRGADAQVEALLAEGQGTLLAALPAGTLDMDRLEGMDAAQRRWLRERGRWRAEAEALCEEHIRDAVLGGGKPEPVQGAVAVAAALGMGSLERMSCRELDGTVRDLSRALARHELELSRLVLQFHRADGWRRLGYVSETQYARERLGMSRSSLVARRALALRLEQLPRVAEALGAAQVGVEAAMQIVRVATPSTQAAWVERARQRTIRFLREEVSAALTAMRLSGEADCLPPVDAEMVAFHALEQAVVSGRACGRRPDNDCHPDGGVDVVGLVEQSAAVDVARPVEQGGAVDFTQDVLPQAQDVLPQARLEEPASGQRRAWLVMLGSLARWLEGGLQMSAAGARPPVSSVGSSAGRVALRLRVSRSNYAWWRGLEAQARRWLPCGMSWLRFLCLSLWEAWRHLLGPDVKYGQIYIRDRYRCTSPVCSRKDVTPHHLQFRSGGGSDDDSNVTSPCTWCHLHGIHGGRIRATGSADLIHWELGPRACPCLVVHGRERVAA